MTSLTDKIQSTIKGTALGLALASTPATAQTITPGYDLTKRTSDVRVELTDTRGPLNTYAFMDLSGNRGSGYLENGYGIIRSRIDLGGERWLPQPTIRYETGTGMRDNIHIGLSDAASGKIGKTDLFALGQIYWTREGLRSAIFGSATRGNLEGSVLIDSDKNVQYIEGNLSANIGDVSPNLRVRTFNGIPSYSVGVKIPLK